MQIKRLLKPCILMNFSDRYSLFQLKHYFNKFQISKSIKPILVVGSKVAFGGFSHPENHQGITFKTMEKVFMKVDLNCKIFLKALVCLLIIDMARINYQHLIKILP